MHEIHDGNNHGVAFRVRHFGEDRQADDFATLPETIDKEIADRRFDSLHARDLLELGLRCCRLGVLGAKAVHEFHQPRDFALLVLVSRPQMRLANYLCNRLLALAANLLFAARITDEATCYKVFDAALLREVPLTCRRFGVSRDAFYRWRGRLEASGPGALEDASHRPQKVRTPTWSKELENTVLELRRLTPGWGKDKLGALLHDEGWQCSTSMVGRILKQLKESGRLAESPRADPWTTAARCIR